MNQVDLGARGLFPLLLLSGISTLGALTVFRRFSDRAAMGRAANRILAHLMELGLFFDEPMLVLRAQGGLIRENLTLLRLIALPCALLVLPFAIFFTELDAIFDRAPLVVGTPSVVTVKLAGSSPALDPTPVLEAPRGIQIETPGVRIISSHEVSWQIRPVQGVRGQLKIEPLGRGSAGPVFTERIFAGPGLIYAVPFRQASIRIRYPRATILHLDWILWYILASIVTAFGWRASQIRNC